MPALDRSSAPSPSEDRRIRLADYRPPSWLVDGVRLTFRLAPKATRVVSRIAFRPNPATPDRRFFLHGADLTLISATIDGAAAEVTEVPGGIEVAVPDTAFVWEAEVEIAPATNTALEGLYMSNGMYCTQCEAEGFRKITYYPDRPDVMAPFDVRIEGAAPVLMSNGNLVGSGDGWAEWHDPWPKPAYLFALVAGDLVAYRDGFTTRSGRAVDLAIWVRAGDEDRCAYAMDALKRSMAWDEDVYGREYDLDVFNVVAVDDFNMGAMENKGLNIFNSALVLASPETATDGDFEQIEAVIAHEYFHNWTGNRITCRDWFQLCLKEGLTVYRDQQFTGDMRSHPVKRIEDALLMRARQFREDSGPLAHPVRPESFIEINNFYTITVYEKGAELIGVLRRFVGDAAYAKALDLYFQRHDGDAATIEDWLRVFEDVTGRDLTQFLRWYGQAGTPRLDVVEEWSDGTYTLTFRQHTPPTPDQSEKLPVPIPVAVGLLSPDGKEVAPTRVCEVTDAEQSFDWTGLDARPVPSILRGFSAPVIVTRQAPKEHRALLFAHDTDPFNRWDAGRAMAKDLMVRMVLDGAAPDAAFLDGLRRTIADESLDPAYRALILSLPSQDDIAQTLFDMGQTPDPAAIHKMKTGLVATIAAALEEDLATLYDLHQVAGPYSPDATAAGHRDLAGAALTFLTRRDDGARAAAQFAAADNMTQSLGALSALLDVQRGKAELDAFEARWSAEPLVMDKWFSLQTMLAQPAEAAATAARLADHPAFDWGNPNRFRALFGGLAGNAPGFHEASGAAYALLADWLIRLDARNPQLAARMTTVFETWRRYDPARQKMIRAALTRIGQRDGLSRDTDEMVTRLLASA